MLCGKVGQARRRLLKITGYSLLAGAFGHAANTAITALGRDSHTPLVDSMRAIGEAYLNRYPAERSRSALLDAIQSRSGLVDPAGGGPTPAVLNRLVIEDFRTDDVVYLNGWALSHTEARLAALTVV
jgi:hypothetical protein